MRLATMVAISCVFAATSAQAEPRLLKPSDIRGVVEDYAPDAGSMAGRRYPGQPVQVACTVYTPPGVNSEGRPFTPRFGECHVVGEAAGLDYIDGIARNFQQRARPAPGVTGDVLIKMRIPE